MTIKTSKFDAADYLTSQADIEAYLEAALEENDPAFFQKALGTVARAQGMQAVADKSKAFQTCIDGALRRNPNLAVGSITVVLNVGTSGAVRSAGIEPKKHEVTDWGQCIMSTGKRIVFPGSDAETQVELPFKVGVAVTP